MAREFDARKTGAAGVSDARLVELHEVAAATSDNLPGAHRVVVGAFDEATGNPSLVVSRDAGAVAPEAYLDRASAHLDAISPVLGIGRDAEARYRVDPVVAITSSGAAASHAQQENKKNRGVPGMRGCALLADGRAGVNGR